MSKTKKTVKAEPTYEEKIKSLAKRLGKKSSVLLKEFEENAKKWKSRGAEDPELIAYRQLIAVHRKRPTFKGKRSKSVPIPIQGFKLGSLGPHDRAATYRDIAKKFKNKHGLKKAMDEGYFNNKGELLDRRETIYGRENDNFGKPYPKDLQLWRNVLYLLRKLPEPMVKELNRNVENKEDWIEWELAMIQTDDKRVAHAWQQVPNFIPCTTFGIDKGLKSLRQLNASMAESTKSIFKKLTGVEWDVYSIIEKTFENTYTPLKEVEDFHDQNKDQWDRWIVVKGLVSFLGDKTRAGIFGIPLTLTEASEEGVEEESQVRAYMDPKFPITFGPFSEVIFFGKTRVSKYRDPESGEWVPGDVVIDVWAHLPIPGKSTAPLTEEVESLEETELVGWID